VAKEASDTTSTASSARSLAIEIGKFAFFAALTVVAAWVAATGRVAYMFTMLVIAVALGYAVLDCVGYEIVKKRRQR
jgi:heme/copper-type cytochrome/quinol oxidase subunit 4